MANEAEHAEAVLAAIIPDRRDLLDKALRQLTPDHFPERNHSRLFAILQRYAEVTGGSVIPLNYLEDLVKRQADVGQAHLYTELYQSLELKKVDDAAFAWSIGQLRDIASVKATSDALTEAMDILRNGKLIGKETLRGHEHARTRLLESFQAIDRDLLMQDAPEGDLKNEAIDMLADYAERKAAFEKGISYGIRFGIPDLDLKIGGMQNGELILSAAPSGTGKTTLAVQAAWHAAVQQGKNVVFLTTETLRPQVRRKIIARHSKLPHFELPEGLNTRDLKAGTLSHHEELKLKDVISDLAKNPAYGHLYVAQVPRSANILSIEQRLHRINRQFPVDFVVMDYLALLRADSRRTTTREELAQIIKDAKLLAVNFDDGRGVPFMSPWQMSRSSQEMATSIGMFTMNALAETAEATNSADLIVSILAPLDNSDRYSEVSMQVLKNRDGETLAPTRVRIDYATSYFQSLGSGVSALQPVPTSSLTAGNGFSMDGLFDNL